MVEIINAIQALDPNAWVGVSNNDINKIHWHDGNPNKLTKEQIQAKYDELVEEYKKLQYQRDRKYPELGEQLDLLYHDMTAGKGDKTGEWYKAVNKVKTDNPKPE